MHEIKVYDRSGKLIKVISTQTLNIRSKQKLETPEIFHRNKRGRGTLKIFLESMIELLKEKLMIIDRYTKVLMTVFSLTLLLNGLNP
jgi:hypothetical protein